MASWKNTKTRWGWVSISVHWLTALLVLGLYLVGDYMVDLDYYDPWYRDAPFWHKSFGIFLAFIILFRLGLRFQSGVPDAIESHARWEKLVAHCVHLILYLLLLVVLVSGYLISTADGRGVSVFGLFDLPALVSDIDNLEDLAGEVHELSTDTLLVLVGLHALGALKHHFIDRDDTLRRMLGISKKEN